MCAISYSEQTIDALREALAKVERPKNKLEEQRKAKIQTMIDQAMSEKSIRETSKQVPSLQELPSYTIYIYIYIYITWNLWFFCVVLWGTFLLLIHSSMDAGTLKH